MPDIVWAVFILAAFFIVLAVLAWIADDRVEPPREDHHIPEDEQVLIGDDWRVHVTDYANARRERWNTIQRVTQETDDE